MAGGFGITADHAGTADRLTNAVGSRQSRPGPSRQTRSKSLTMKKIGLVSLGCEKNLVDSEVMLGLLRRRGYEITAQAERADVIVVNTCGFIDKAKQESVDTILEMAEFKNSGQCSRLVVTGCLVERYRDEIQTEIPEVDAVMGTTQLESIIDLCEGRIPPSIDNRYYLYDENTPRLLTTPGYTAYIKVAEGCDRPCSFCVIPKIRGAHRSRPMASILKEARFLADGGVKEIVLLSQETTHYGVDLGIKQGLSRLLRELTKVEGIRWIRFLYAFPSQLGEDVLVAMQEEEKICRYLDMPLQHASGRILRSMKRGGNRSSLSRLLDRVRERVPGITLRTSMIVGYPGETEEEFAELCRFVETIQFDRLGTFTFSDEEEAGTYHLDGKVPQALIERRRRRLMGIQAKISRRKNRSMVGKRQPVLIEGKSAESDLLWQGRLESQAPRIDGVVLINDLEGAVPDSGEFGDVEITQAMDYDLVGRLV